MKNKFFRLIACLLAAAMLLSIAVLPIAAVENSDDAAENTEAVEETTEEAEAEAETEEAEADAEEPEAEADVDADAEEESGSKKKDDEPLVYLTDEEEIANCVIAAENANFILYLHEKYERVGLYVKASGKVYWTNCVNARLDKATSKPATRQDRLSNVGVKYGNVTQLFTASAYNYSYRQSTDKEKTKFEITPKGVKITYSFETAKADIPLYLELEDDYLYAYINTSEIKEKSGYVEGVNEEEETKKDVLVLTDIALLPFMAAVEADDPQEGYMFVPDGSGAIIRLNNGRSNYANYSQSLYGRDLTKVRDLEPDAMEPATLPVMAISQGNNGLVMIATEGDTFATVNAAIANNKRDQAGYNYCYFSFIVRSTDDYHMAGDSSTIIVFEKGDGKIPVEKLGVRYYPIVSEEETVSYADIAGVYRDYLIKEKGLTKKTTAGYSPLFVDYFGGTLKAKSILGIPIDIKTAYTTFDQAVEITGKLKDLGVDQIVVNYNDWTNDSMSDKIDTADSIAGVLGGKSDFKKMLKYFKDNNVQFYGSIDGFTFKSGGNGFITLFDTAYRVSKSYARPYNYNVAYGTPERGVVPALLAPKSINKLATKVSKNMSKYDLPGAGIGSIVSNLWSDFSNKNHTNRATTAEYIVNYFNSVKDSIGGKMIAKNPNAYIIPYADAISNVPLQSSQFKIADLDVPFIQMVLHGYVDYSSVAINSSAESKALFLRALAAGSNIQYDFIYNEATKLVNTDYVGLYYATYKGWLDQCAGEYKLANEILTKVSDAVITDYKVDGSVITTTYSNGVVTVIDIESGDIKAGGKTYKYSDYVDEGGLR